MFSSEWALKEWFLLIQMEGFFLAHKLSKLEKGSEKKFELSMKMIFTSMGNTRESNMNYLKTHENSKCLKYAG